jgi:hypothetical protein
VPLTVPVAPVPSDTLPQAPSASQPTTFDALADAFVAAQAPFGTQLNALALNAYANAISAYAAALAANTSAADANSSAIAAAASSNAVKWVSGTTYADGFVVWSPLSRLTYRRIGAGAGITDPSIDTPNWAIQLLALGMGGVALTGNVSLTSLSPAAMTVTPTGPGLYVILGDATTYLKAACLMAITNLGEYDYGIKNNAGTVLGWVRAKSSATIGLVDSSTSAGVWLVSGAHKTGVTAEFATSAIPSQGGFIQRVTIDSTRTFLMFGSPGLLASEVYGVVFDSSQASPWGSPVLIRAGATEAVATLSGASQILVASIAGTAFEAVTIAISGTGLTVNSANKITSTFVASSSFFTQLQLVGAAWAFGYVAGSVTSSYVRALTVSGNTPALGAAIVLTATVGIAPLLFATGSILRAVYLDTTNLNCLPFSISGNTLTPGTLAATSVSGGGVASTYLRAIVNSNGNIACQYVATGGNRVAVFKLTGTAEAVTSASVSGLAVPALVNGEMIAISGGSCAVAFADASGNLRFNVVMDSAGTASAPAEITLSGTGLLTVSAAAVSGAVVRFLASGSSASSQITIDYSGGSAVIQSLHAMDSMIGIPPTSDTKGRASYQRLSAGTTLCTIGSGKAFEGMFTASGGYPLQSKHLLFAGGTPGAAANESWTTAQLGSAGTSIKRIEACA